MVPTLSAVVLPVLPVTEPGVAVWPGKRIWIRSAASALTVAQNLRFDLINVFGAFSQSTSNNNDWSGNPFPFGAAEITQVQFDFSSLDGSFNSGIGPSGGDVGVEVGYLDDSNARFAMASVGHNNHLITIGPGNDPVNFNRLIGLLTDGILTLSLGGFENFPLQQFSDGLVIDGGDVLVTVTGENKRTVPEPASLGLLVGGLGVLAWRRRKTV